MFNGQLNGLLKSKENLGLTNLGPNLKNNSLVGTCSTSDTLAEPVNESIGPILNGPSDKDLLVISPTFVPQTPTLEESIFILIEHEAEIEKFLLISCFWSSTLLLFLLTLV